MLPYPIIPDIPKHITLYFHFMSLQRDDHLCWNFVCDLLRASELVLAKFPSVWWSSAVRISISRRDHRFRWFWGKISWIFEDHGHDPICWMLWYHVGFFQTTAGVGSDRPYLYFELLWFFLLLRQILFTSVPLYYFDLKSDWLPWLTCAFGSPPEVLPIWYLLFVTIG